jgi:NAD-dependent dihydropyrimidine dehydrogenase PreA subunit
VEVCPVDCIHPTPDEPNYDQVEMLYIDPEECMSYNRMLWTALRRKAAYLPG